MKFRVGDKVKVKENLECNATYDRTLFVCDMQRFKGKILTVRKVGDGYYKLDGANWSFSEPMLEMPERDATLCCPFCGNQVEVKKYLTPNGNHWQVICEDCTVAMTASTKEQVIDKWNRRT